MQVVLVPGADVEVAPGVAEMLALGSLSLTLLNDIQRRGSRTQVTWWPASSRLHAGRIDSSSGISRG